MDTTGNFSGAIHIIHADITGWIRQSVDFFDEEAISCHDAAALGIAHGSNTPGCVSCKRCLNTKQPENDMPHQHRDSKLFQSGTMYPTYTQLVYTPCSHQRPSSGSPPVICGNFHGMSMSG